MRAYVFLAGAIIAEVIATTALKASDGFTRPWPSILTALGYAAAFFLLAQTLRSLPTGMVYAMWSGIGIVLISIAAWFVHGQKLDLPAVIGMGLIIAGVAVMNMFSSTAH